MIPTPAPTGPLDVSLVEVAYTKLAWILGNYSNYDEITEMITTNVVGEKGKPPQTTLSLLLFAVFYGATTLFNSTDSASSTFSQTLSYIFVFAAAFVFLVVFLLVFIGHPDLDETE